MSVIVMGVDIPEDCDSCWLPGKHCNLWLATDVGERHRVCPLRPLPEKHGRLIDAQYFDEMHFVDGLREGDKLYVPFIEVSEIIFKAPTIVEAEGE